jgi:hypothetical protein
MNPFFKYTLASLYRLAVLAGLIYVVRLVLLIGAGGWLFLILPAVLVFLAVAPSSKVE